MAYDRIADEEIVMARRVWGDGWSTVPGIGVAHLPKLACPLCWPFYSGIVSSAGLGFLLSISLRSRVSRSRLNFRDLLVVPHRV
jgi:hypothetical protein